MFFVVPAIAGPLARERFAGNKLGFNWSEDDVIKARFPFWGYPPQGQFRVICSELVDDKHWPQGDYTSLKKAVEVAKRNSGFSKFQVFCAGVYNHKGQQLL